MAVKSTGLRVPAKGISSFSFFCADSGSGSISSPASEAASAIITAAPPEIEPTATLRPFGRTPLLAAWVMSISSSTVRQR